MGKILSKIKRFLTEPRFEVEEYEDGRQYLTVRVGFSGKSYLSITGSDYIYRCIAGDLTDLQMEAAKKYYLTQRERARKNKNKVNVRKY